MDKTEGFADARNKNDHIHWCITHYALSIPQQAALSQQILSKTHTELSYIERSVFMEEVYNQKLWNFEMGSQKSMNSPICKIKGFQQRDRQNSQNLKNDSFCRLPVTSAKCIIGTEKHPDAGIILNYVDGDYSQGYAQIKKFLEFEQKTTSSYQMYLMMILDLQLLGLLSLVKNFTFPKNEIRKTS